jgi:hypothetical protein
MQLLWDVDKAEYGAAETVTVRVLVLNNSYEPVTVDRRLFVGPNPVPEHSAGAAFPVSLEPTLPREEENLVTLNPWCLYGRQRSFDGLPSGRVTFHAYLLRRTSGSLLPERPAEPEALLVAAAPLVVAIQRGL